jgi:multidrug transporter EmrE-like cation transporter
MDMRIFGLILASVSFNAFAQIVLRKAMLKMGAVPSFSEPLAVAWALLSNAYLWAGITCYVLSLGLWLAVLSNVQVSIAYPMLSIGYVIAAVLGWFFLGETIGLARSGGILLICAGVVLVSRTA